MFKNNGISIEYFAFRLPFYGAIGFILFNMIAMVIYPGGTYQNPACESYVFSQNYFSDLGQTQTMDGTPNFYASFFFNNGLLIIGLLTCLFYFYLPMLFKQNPITYKIAIIASIIAITSGIAFSGIALTPSNLYLDAHMFFVHWAFRSYLITAILYIVAIYKSQEWENKYALLYIVFACILFGYVLILEFGPDGKDSLYGLTFQVVSQKIIVISFVVSTIFISNGANEVYKNLKFY
ncbi:MAG: hypothetical protein ISR83_00915 [Candidatus Marinimicrobia bacterium]|nr:hypothetical protein [Candidatus Neomarinimicrobiota bacterium]